MALVAALVVAGFIHGPAWGFSLFIGLMVGLIGHLAAVPAGSAVDPCCCCPNTDTLDAVVSGFTVCGDGIAIQNATPPFYYKVTAHTGITGAYTAVSVLDPGAWTAVIGTVTVQEYSDVGITPQGSPYDLDVKLFIQCVLGQITVEIGIGIGQPIDFSSFIHHLATLDDALSNEVTCECTEISPGVIYCQRPFLNSVVTISLP